MLDLIFTIKFVHVLAASVMLGTWLALALFMLMAHRSGNTSVVALTARFVVRVEWMVVAGAIALQPLSGFPLAAVIGVSPFGELWILLSLVLYIALVVAWGVSLRLEMRIRDLTRDAALEAKPLSAQYARLFRIWSTLAMPILAGMVAIVALMIWQPRLD
jgi:uncharacterized membrane protein